MKKLNKKQKLFVVIGSVAVVCLIAVGVLYAAGVIPSQGQGLNFLGFYKYFVYFLF